MHVLAPASSEVGSVTLQNTFVSVDSDLREPPEFGILCPSVSLTDRVAYIWGLGCTVPARPEAGTASAMKPKEGKAGLQLPDNFISIDVVADLGHSRLVTAKMPPGNHQKHWPWSLSSEVHDENNDRLHAGFEKHP